ncbi:hypothetical protein V2O64_16695 [Verrucomicrobiaceae bacterium 227]
MKKPAIIFNLISCTWSLCAQNQIDSTGITATSTGPAQAGNFGPEHTLDGLTKEGWQDGDPAHPTRPGAHQGTHWITNDIVADENGDFSSTITYDLGGSYDLAEIHILNTSNTAWNDRETDSFTIETSTDNGATFDLGDAFDLTRIEVLNTSNTNWNDRETDTLTIEVSNDGGNSYGVPSAPIAIQDYTAGFQTIPLSAAGVTHVRLNVENNPGLGTNTGVEDVAVGLNEVRFYTGSISSLGTQITSIDYISGATSATITWNSSPGRAYLVEFSDDLIIWDEAPDGESVPASAEETTSFTISYDPVAPVTRRYFRITRL